MPQPTSPSSVNKVQTIRIAQGKLWLNGNLIAPTHLPPSLAKVSKESLFEASWIGLQSFSFMLEGIHYVVKENKVVELSPYTDQNKQLLAPSGNKKDMSSDEEISGIYQEYKNQDPEGFNSMATQAMLEARIWNLLGLYQTSSGKTRLDLYGQIQENLSMLFDMDIYNKRSAVEQLRKQLDAIETDLNYRETHKDKILDTKMQDLIKSAP